VACCCWAGLPLLARTPRAADSNAQPVMDTRHLLLGMRYVARPGRQLARAFGLAGPAGQHPHESVLFLLPVGLTVLWFGGATGSPR